MQPAAKATLVSLVQDHITAVVNEAVCISRHTKRARYHPPNSNSNSSNSNSSNSNPSSVPTTVSTDSHNQSSSSTYIRRRLHADDINMALEWRGASRLYGTPVVVPNDADSNKKVDLNTYLQTEMAQQKNHHPSSELAMTLHWLAVNGAQPTIPQNPTITTANNLQTKNSITGATAAAARVSDTEDYLDSSSSSTSAAAAAAITVRQLLPRLLSEELQLYFTRITLALEKGDTTPTDRQQQDAALLRVARDAGLQELVPFWMQYLGQHLRLHMGNPQHLRVLMRLARSLLCNPHLHLELHLHQLLPPLITCVVAKSLGNANNESHWTLRLEAAHTLLHACELFGDKYLSLKATVLKKLCQAAMDTHLTTVYGGLMGIALFGPKAVDAFVAPLAVGYWKKWEAMLSRTTTETSTTETSTTAPPSTTTMAETAAEIKPMEKEDNKEGEESTATTTSTTTTTTTTTATTKKNTTTLKPLDLNQQFVILQCQQAMLDCLGTMGIEEQAERMDVTEMEDVFGERLIPLRCRARFQQLEGREQKDEWMNIAENEYAMCFI